MKNSEKAINFLSLMSCSINKLKSLMFFAFKKFMFSDYMWKKIFAAKNGGGGGRWGLAPPCPSFLYSSGMCNTNKVLKVVLKFGKLS